SWQYLGWKVTETSIQPLKVKLNANISTLNDLQKLLNTSNWIQPILGISTEQLSPLL
ncbi:POK8 protein, partial [Serilophus lunatus]|nr:POK8 protein [Serilophus lunatus]